MSRREDVYATVYSPTFLSRVYDYYVLGFNMRFIWRCPTDTILLPFFAENFSRRHLDVGVATGYLPAKALERPWRTPGRNQHLTLLDINANSLRASEARVRAVAPAIDTAAVEADVTADLPPELAALVKEAELLRTSSPGAGKQVSPLFDSISMFNLFHCVPGWPEKLRAIRTYKALLSDAGVLSGCTVLGQRHAPGWFSRWYVRLYNRRGFFNNLDDTREGFEEALRAEFDQVDTVVVGMVLLFRAARPRRDHGAEYVDLLS